MEKRNYTVYIHINKTNNKKYVGITSQQVEKRWKNGLGYEEQIFGRAIQKYGWDGFEHVIICDKQTQLEAFKKEQELIQLYDTTNPDYGYNKSDGGESGSYHAYNVQINRMTQVYRYDASGNYIDCFCSIEEAKRQLKINGSNISQCCKGLRKLAYGYQWSHEYLGEKIDPVEDGGRRTNKSRMRKVSQYSQNGELIRIYECITDAQRETGINRCAIGNCCKGKTKTAGGYIWEYAND
jgi:hypothetical protein